MEGEKVFPDPISDKGQNSDYIKNYNSTITKPTQFKNEQRICINILSKKLHEWPTST